MENSKNELFSTRDLYMAATLVTLKFYMSGVDYSIEGSNNQPVGYFRFENNAALHEAKNKYLQGMLTVEPKAFMQNLRALKAEIVNVHRNPLMNF